MKKRIGIIIFVLIIMIILALSVYLPNKDKINDETEDKSVIYTVIIDENEKYGVKNQNDEIVIEANYEKIIIPNEHRAVFFCQDGEETVILNEQNETIFEEYDNVQVIRLTNILEETYEKNALIYEKNGMYGLLSITGKVILDAKYEQIYSLGNKENEVIVKDNNKYQIYDVKGKQLIKDEFDSIESDQFYSEEDGYIKSGYIVCKITSDGYRYGYYDYEYNKVLEIEYNQISRIVEVNNKNNVYLLVAKNGQYGVLINNTEIINTQYQSITYDSYLQLFIVERSGTFGAFSENGTEILKTEYNSLQIKGIYLYAEKGEEQKVFDKNGKEVEIPFTTVIEKTDNSNYYIKIENDKYGVINENQETLIECEYDLIQLIKNTNIFHALNFENNTTYLFDKNLNKILEINNANIEVVDDKVRVYNETEEYNFDIDGNLLQEEVQIENNQ